MKRSRSAQWPVAAALYGLVTAVHAVNIGISPGNGPVVNPFTNQETSVWKLVGRAFGCTAYQITPEWIVTSVHCVGGATGSYSNDRLAPSVQVPLRYNETLTLPNGDKWPICTPVSEPTAPTQTDIYICRLADTKPFAAAGPFPPLVVGPIPGNQGQWPTVPSYQQLAKTGAKYGSLLFGGRAGPDLIAFTGFNGLPYGYSPITDPLGKTIPELEFGDSGGALFSFSPLTGQAAFAGITTHPLQFFSTGAIAFIKDHIAQYAALTNSTDQPPATVTTLAHYGNTTDLPPADLSAPPVGLSLSGSMFSVGWQAAPDASVTSYSVTYGHDGAITGRATVAAGGPLKLAIPTQGASKLTVCAQPVNPFGAGNLAIVLNRFPGARAFATPNCSTFDVTRWAPPAAPTSVTLGAALDPKSRLMNVSATWAPPSAPLPVVASYRVSGTTAYGTGPKRSFTRDTKAPSFSTLTTSGSTVCVRVAAISDIGVLGSYSNTVCKLAP